MEVISQVFFGHVKMYVFDTVSTDKANILKQPLKRNILKMCFILFVHFLFSDCLLKPGFQLEEEVIDNDY